MFRLPWESACRTEARSSGSWRGKALLWRVPPSLLLLNDAGGEGWRSETCEQEQHVFTSVRRA